jgi:hypothetical protein
VIEDCNYPVFWGKADGWDALGVEENAVVCAVFVIEIVFVKIIEMFIQ